MSDEENQEKGREKEEEGEPTLAEKRERSEKISRKAFKGTKEGIHSTSSKKKGPGGIKGKKMSKFEDLFEAYLKGATVEEMAERFNLTLETVTDKLPALKLAKVRFGIDKAAPSAPPSGNEGAPSTINQTTPATAGPPSPPSGMIAGPVPAVTPPSTYTVPAGTPGGIVPVIQGKVGGAVSSEGEEEGEGPETPPWMKGDGRETVNTIEMAIRGVNSKETFSPVTILLLSYLKYLGGPDMSDMAFGEMVDWAVRRLCKEKGIDIQIGRNYLPENVRM